jgi:hypothetical protein
MCNSDDLDFIACNSIYKAEWKSRKDVSAGTMFIMRPPLGRLGDLLNGMH